MKYKELFEELGQLRIKEREIKSRIEEILPTIYEEADGVDNGTVLDLDSGLGNFTVSYLRKWKFPSNVEELKKKYKDSEDESKQLGTATYTEAISLKFNENKEE